MSLTLFFTPKSLAVFYVGQPLSALVLDLLSTCKTMSNRTIIVRGSNPGGTPLEKWAILYSSTRLNEAKVKHFMIVTVVSKMTFLMKMM